MQCIHKDIKGFTFRGAYRSRERMSPGVDLEAWRPRLARAVLENTLGIRRGDVVGIEAWTEALPWVPSFVTEARKLGASTTVLYEDDGAFWAAAEHGDARSTGLNRAERALLNQVDAYVYFWGPADRLRYRALDRRTMAALDRVDDEWIRVASSRPMRWCRLEVSRVTPELAKVYDVAHDAWLEEVLEGTVIQPRELSRGVDPLARRLTEGRKVSIEHPNGTSLSVQLMGALPILDVGRAHPERAAVEIGRTNLPGGYVVVPLDERSGTGTFVANRPSRYGAGGGRADGGRWTFQDGRLAARSFASGGEAFEASYARGGKGRDRIASLSIGLNPAIRDSPLLEDQERGVVGLFIGGNDWFGGRTHSSFHSWLLLRGADVSVDGEPVVRRGHVV